MDPSALSLSKLDRPSGEGSSDMVTLRKQNVLRDWMCNAATDGWCVEWACETPAPKTLSVQHKCEDHDQDTMKLTVCFPIWERCGAL